ncbi:MULTISPECIES: helix-turn-helix domain-containing protein [unclassified Streptomyces]|uniref:TetR/AcrR family transcriptional regulator n=1 Tax=unclassified Streptomyces TaxID=2593676 RepID=UPI00336A538F
MVNELPLRERKKLRTREALVETALALFSEKGFGAVTLDELVAAVEVSKRTFFRTFSSKEDVALAPEKELWAAYTARIEAHPLTGPLLAAIEDTLFAAVADMADGWERRFRVSRALADRTPALTAHSLGHCADVTDAIVRSVTDRRPDPATDELRVRLLLELMLAAWRCALKDWAQAPGDPGRDALRARTREAFDAIPDVAELASTGTGIGTRTKTRSGAEPGTAPGTAPGSGADVTG